MYILHNSYLVWAHTEHSSTSEYWHVNTILHHLYLVWAHTEHTTPEYIFPCCGDFCSHTNFDFSTVTISTEIISQWLALRKLKPKYYIYRFPFHSKKCKNTNTGLQGTNWKQVKYASIFCEMLCVSIDSRFDVISCICSEL